jgi:hypothetical protein
VALSTGFEALLQELIALEAPAPLLKQVAGMEASEIRLWIETVDESPYPLCEWASALVLFSIWERDHRTLPLSQKREYLSCCVEGAGGSSSLLPLTGLLDHYLKTQGVRD